MQMSSKSGHVFLHSLVISKNFCEHHLAGGLLHIILAAPLNKYCNPFLRYMSRKHHQKISFVIVLFLTTTLIASFALTPYSGLASTENNNTTLIEPDASQGMATPNAPTTTNIVLVHGAWADGSSWSKVIPILQNAGHRVIAVQLPLHSV